ncbi:MAG: hypothetical protein ACFFBD_16140 [Candidatus Hodarchaeota archaeon]
MFSKRQQKMEWSIKGKFRVTKEEKALLQELWRHLLKHFDSKLFQFHTEGKLRSETLNQITKIFRFEKAGTYNSHQMQEYERLFSQTTGLFKEKLSNSDFKPQKVPAKVSPEQIADEIVNSSDEFDNAFPVPNITLPPNQAPSLDQSSNDQNPSIETRVESLIPFTVPEPPADVNPEEEEDRHTGIAVLRNQMLSELIKIREILNPQASVSS